MHKDLRTRYHITIVKIIVPPPKSLKKVLHISNEKSKEQEAQPNNGHGKKDFPNKIAWILISSECTDLLHRIIQKQCQQWVN